MDMLIVNIRFVLFFEACLLSILFVGTVILCKNDTMYPCYFDAFLPWSALIANTFSADCLESCGHKIWTEMSL
ncbi:hypothetical protein Hanom_Chr00s000005g01611711 [Helianthus anomalus]